MLSIPYYKRGIVELKFPLKEVASSKPCNPAARGENSYCRPEDVLGPGDSCNIYSTNIDFWVTTGDPGRQQLDN